MSEVATERVITYMNPGSSEGKSSIGKMATRTSASFPDGEAKPIPNYLRTSSSSCHDFCKYGKKHDLEVKKRLPIHRRLTSKKETTLHEKNQVTVVTQSERRMKENVQLVASQDKITAANRQNDLPPEKITPVSDISTENIIQASDLPPEKIIQVSLTLADSPANLTQGSAQAFSDMNFGFASIIETPTSVFGHERANQADRSSEESTCVEQMTPATTISTRNESDEHVSSESSELSSDNPTCIKLDQKATKSSDENSEFASKNACSSEECTEEGSSMKREGRLPAALVTARSAINEGDKVTGYARDAETKKDMSKLHGKVIGARERTKVIRKAKADTSLESNGKQKITPPSRNSVSCTKIETRRKISTSNSLVTPIVKNKASSTGLAQKNNEKTVKVSSSLDRGAEKALKQSPKFLSVRSHPSSAPSANLRVNSQLSPISQGKIQTREGKLGVKKGGSDFNEPKSEKINRKTNLKQKSPLSGAKDGDYGFKFEADKSTLRKEVTRRTSGVVLRSEINRQLRRTSGVHSQDKISTPHKLKFNRGKIVSLQPDTSLLKILRFRRAKTEGQNVKGDLDTKEYRNRSGRIGAVSKSAIPKAQAVVLRHQDVQEKKDAQGLLNQVIEETASKLVETRKSKVKALVGAFETVISLQESKMAPVSVAGNVPVV